MLDYAKQIKPSYAIYAPATCDGYLAGSFFPGRTNPPFFGRDLDFTYDQNPFFYYDTLLTSAGQTLSPRSFYQTRDRSKIRLIGDSGGYQVEQGTVKFKGDETCEAHLRWLEQHCDDFMVLDFPTGGISKGTVTKHIKRLNETGYPVIPFAESIGLDPNDDQQLAFAACLYQTIINNDYFHKHRKGTGNMLSALQGRNLKESNLWYEHVKSLPCEGYAMAGAHKSNFELLLTRIIGLIEDKKLKPRIHILGTSRLDLACVYSTIQQCLQQYCPGLLITYDSSSAVTSAAKQRAMVGYTLTNKKWGYEAIECKFNDYEYTPNGNQANKKPHDILRPKSRSEIFVESEIFKQLTMKDVCAIGKQGGIMDMLGYCYLMNHNLQVTIEATIKAQEAYATLPLHAMPENLATLKQIIPDILSASDPRREITRYARQLKALGDHHPTPTHALFEMPAIKQKAKCFERKSNTHKAPITPPKTISSDLQDLCVSHAV